MNGNMAEIHIDYDENILLNQRVIKKKEKYHTLETGMFIGDRIETFSKVNMFDNKMEITLPDSFGVMPDNYARVKYPSSFRPHIILTNVKLTANFGFSLFSQKIEDEETDGMAVYLKNILKRSNPAIQFYSQKTIKTLKCTKVVYDFRTQALDEAIYNIHFLAAINSRVMLGIFNCLYRDTDEWYEMVQQIIGSVKDISMDWRK